MKAGHAPLEGDWGAFREYPIGDFIDLLVAAAPKLFPDVTLRRAIRNVGQLAYPTFAETMIGAMLFNVLGGNVRRMTGVANKAYRYSIRPGKVSVLEKMERSSWVRLEDVYVFPDAFQIGVFEGAILAAGKDVDGRYCRRGGAAVDLFFRWRERV